MVHHNTCSTKLTLSLGFIENTTPLDDEIMIKTSQKNDQSLALGLYAEVITPEPCRKQHEKGSSVSGISSFSIGSVKREREFDVEESTKIVKDQDEEGPRKKLRLTKKQSIVLEDSFKEQITLNPRQKQALANMLGLKPRQVEVWFQNRRARMKLKQIEMDSELLKKYCESLREENRRLNKELQDLKATKVTAAPPFYMQLPATTINIMCPSCQRIGGGSVENPSSNISFSIGAKPNFCSQFQNPSNFVK